MRVLLDSNILISAAISAGTVRSLLARIIRAHSAFCSEEGFSEVRRKLLSKLGQSKADVDEYVRLLRRGITVLPLQSTVAKVSRDPKDDWVLAAAVSAHCHCILSGDADLTDLGSHQGIPILRPRDFLAFEAGRFKLRRQR